MRHLTRVVIFGLLMVGSASSHAADLSFDDIGLVFGDTFNGNEYAALGVNFSTPDVRLAMGATPPEASQPNSMGAQTVADPGLDFNGTIQMDFDAGFFVTDLTFTIFNTPFQATAFDVDGNPLLTIVNDGNFTQFFDFSGFEVNSVTITGTFYAIDDVFFGDLIPSEGNTTASVVILPDTQMYSEAHPEILEAQIDWIVANQAAENIIYVAHLGDLKDDLACDNKVINVGTGGGRTEWQILDDAFSDLDAANIAYGVVPGNHDFDQVSSSCPNFTTQRPLTTYNTLFGPSRFAGDAHYGDPSVPTPGNRVVNSNEDSFTLFEGACGVEFIAINLAYKQGANPAGQDQELQWADALLKAYPNRLGILTNHYFVNENPGNSFGAYGQETYDELSDNPNLIMMLSAHEFGEAYRVETTGRGGMGPVHAMLSDYQRVVFPFADGDPATPFNDPNPAGIDFTSLDETSFGDSGFMRIMRFDGTTGMVNIETFIPPVIPIKNRPGTLVSTYFPASGAGMGNDTASNLSFTFQGYGSNSNCIIP